MTRAATAYAALVAALEQEPPPCRGDNRYLSEHGDIDPELQLRCSTCPVFQLCRDYALADRPAAGIWAGERWADKRKPGRPRKEIHA